MKITGQEVHQIIRHRYPNASIYVLDTEYELVSRDVIDGYYAKFQRSLWKYKLTRWLANVFDCDDFAWHFKGWCGIQRRLTKKSTQLPIGFLCYHIQGNKQRAHAINNSIWSKGVGSLIREIEPQRKGGVTSLTRKERESAWLVVI